jgi:hypothetical protein
MQLKPISAAGVPTALQKAERYRLLNDSSAAESICLDVLAVDPENQAALTTLLLALSDQFAVDAGETTRRAMEVLPRLRDEYRRAYYAGIICERRAKAQLQHEGMGDSGIAADWLHKAMHWYEQAEALRQPGNDEAILRWNTCARLLERHEQADAPASYEPAFD